MNDVIIFIIFFIIFFLIINVTCAICTYYGNKNKWFVYKYEANDISLSYANINDPYLKPYILRRFLSPEYCKKIIEMTNGKLFDSEILDGKVPEIRNSQQCWLSKYDPIIKPIFVKISNMFRIPFKNAENLQVVRYLPGQYYKEHHDSCCDNNNKCFDFIKKAGQRIITVLIYLNDDFTGGYTYFRNLNLKVKPSTGDAIVFFPLAHGKNKCHPLALHAGTPVINGTKWVANVWFREKEFD